MENIRNTKLGTIMTRNLICSYPDMFMTEVSRIFEENEFHHLPVIDKEVCVGVISKSDYFQLQDQFTKSKHKSAEKNNRLFFRSLLAAEVMTADPESLQVSDTIGAAMEIFLQNRVHSIIIKDDDKCVGIVTPFDILKCVNNEVYA